MKHPQIPVIQDTRGRTYYCDGFEDGIYCVMFDPERDMMVCSICEWVDPDSTTKPVQQPKLHRGVKAIEDMDFTLPRCMVQCPGGHMYRTHHAVMGTSCSDHGGTEVPQYIHNCAKVADHQYATANPQPTTCPKHP